MTHRVPRVTLSSHPRPRPTLERCAAAAARGAMRPACDRHHTGFASGSAELHLPFGIHRVARLAWIVPRQSDAAGIDHGHAIAHLHALHVGMAQEHVGHVQSRDTVAPALHVEVLKQVALRCGMGHEETPVVPLEPRTAWAWRVGTPVVSDPARCGAMRGWPGRTRGTFPGTDSPARGPRRCRGCLAPACCACRRNQRTHSTGCGP